MNTNEEQIAPVKRSVHGHFFHWMIVYAESSGKTRKQVLKALKALEVVISPDEARDIYSLASQKRKRRSVRL